MSDPARHARILVVGHSCLDSISVVPDLPPADGKLEADRIWVGPGGPATNAAIALRRLGHEVRFACSVADDPAGRLVADALAVEGIEMLGDPVVGGTTSLAQIRARGNERSVAWKRGRLPFLAPDDEELVRWLDGTELVYVDGHEVQLATRLLAKAAVGGIPTIADPGSLREGAEGWPSQLDSCVATPRWLHARFPGAVSIEEAVHSLGRQAREGALVGVTLGAHGGLAVCGRRRVTWRARKTGVVDTTGAGDAFHAGLADAMLQGMELSAGLDWAATLAAAVCRAPGHSSLPADRDQLILWHGRWGHRPEADASLYAMDPAAI